MWALDLGTTNTLLARFDARTEAPAVLPLPGLSRGQPQAGPATSVGAERAIPTALEALQTPGLWARLGLRGPLARIAPGRLAHIGQDALTRNAVRAAAGFVPGFKSALLDGGLGVVARPGGRALTAREAAHLYLRELFAAADRAGEGRPRELVVTVPVMCFEAYRAEIAAACKGLGVRRVRFLDEPVAAALGYGVGLTGARRALVVDCGGGTMHVALVQLSAAGAQKGEATVLAKAGRRVGGDAVDRWLAEQFAVRAGYRLFEPLPPGETPDVDRRAWERLLLAEARRVKEAVFLAPEAEFVLTPPETLRTAAARARGEAPAVRLTRDALQETLTARGYLADLSACLDEVQRQAEAAGAPIGPGTAGGDVEVLMVGGSTLLPGVYPLFEARFGRDRVRAWQPFEAVALGGAVFAAGRAEPADFIVNDYALLTHDRRTQAAQHTIIVPRGTRFPTAPDLWTRALVPTCARGEPETVFKLVICEVGQPEAERRFTWDAEGRLHALGRADAPPAPIVVELNAADPALGKLDPPHRPSDAQPRLQVSFGVNAERWLCATVTDLRTQRALMRGEPVVRLL